MTTPIEKRQRAAEAHVDAGRSCSECPAASIWIVVFAIRDNVGVLPMCGPHSQIFQKNGPTEKQLLLAMLCESEIVN